MAAPMVRENVLDNLRNWVKKLSSDSVSLANQFAQEAARLNRYDQASRLKALLASVRQQMEVSKRLESAASYGHSKAKLVTSSIGLAVGIGIQLLSKSKQAQACSEHLLSDLGGKELAFGTVLVSVGPDGLPDDVRVVSISRLARESDRQESEVMSGLRERGDFLFSEEAFSHLIERLIVDAEEGRLLLPLPREKLPLIPSSKLVMLEPAEPRWVATPRQE